MAARSSRTKSLEVNLIILISIALAISAILNIYNFNIYRQLNGGTAVVNNNLNVGNTSGIEELSTSGFIKVDNVTVQDFPDYSEIILANNCKGLIGAVDSMQAQSIKDGLEGVLSARPNSHDLMKDAFNVFNIKILMVKVMDVKGGNFVGKLILQQGDKLANLDVRPSDGVALALRTGADVYINSTLFVEKSENIC
ncbi:MAG TPA: bifunctional nuclease family protein [archaeon]|nr:bifunctional nuclease family protein [archaeon]